MVCVRKQHIVLLGTITEDLKERINDRISKTISQYTLVLDDDFLAISWNNNLLSYESSAMTEDVASLFSAINL